MPSENDTAPLTGLFAAPAEPGDPARPYNSGSASGGPLAGRDNASARRSRTVRVIAVAALALVVLTVGVIDSSSRHPAHTTAPTEPAIVTSPSRSARSGFRSHRLMRPRPLRTARRPQPRHGSRLRHTRLAVVELPSATPAPLAPVPAPLAPIARPVRPRPTAPSSDEFF
jgi:hypothetical protein